MPVELAEARPLNVSPADDGRLNVLLITPGQGSSGYYSPEVLEAAAGPAVFPAGTHMYLDHPGIAETFDRPERSVRDLAAVLTEDAQWDGTGLVAEAQVTGPYRDLLADPVLRSAVGVSIRATAEAEQGEVDGRRTTIVTRLVEGLSVDFVTRAGRGGRILMESARPRVTARAVAHGVAEATVNDTRDALAAALSDRFGGDDRWVYVRDFDDTRVWFHVAADGDETTYELGYATSDGAVTLATGDPAPVRVSTTYVPVDPAGDRTTTQESEEDTMPQIEEARLRQLEQDAGRVQTVESERDTQRDRADVAEHQLAIYQAREAARPVAARVVAAAGSPLPPRTAARVVESAVAAVTLTSDGVFDVAAFEAAVTAARDDAAAEVAEIAEASGAGTPRGLGGGHHTTGTVDEAKVTSIVDRVFGAAVKGA